MAGTLAHHTARLRWLATAAVGAVVACCVVVALLPPPGAPAFAQATTLLWAFAVAGALNLLTLTPVQRAMLAGPRRVFAVSGDERPLLAAHLVATTVALARVEAVAILGLLLFVLSGRRSWFWWFAAAALVGMAALWPSRERVRAALGLDAAE